jgi:DinB superfamily
MSTTSATPLRPEQEAALRYVREKGTDAPVASIRERMATTFAELEALLAALPADQVRLRPAPGKWSVHEIVDHLIESHRPAIDELRELVRGHWPGGADSGEPPLRRSARPPLARPRPGARRGASRAPRDRRQRLR